MEHKALAVDLFSVEEHLKLLLNEPNSLLVA
jgi:hypothetical protein